MNTEELSNLLIKGNEREGAGAGGEVRADNDDAELLQAVPPKNTNKITGWKYVKVLNGRLCNRNIFRPSLH